MKPSIGRIVHFQRPGDEPEPAIITFVYEGAGEERGLIDLTAFPRGRPPRPVSRVARYDMRLNPTEAGYMWPLAKRSVSIS